MTVRRILVIHDDPRRAARLALEFRDDGYTMISDGTPTVGLSDGVRPGHRRRGDALRGIRPGRARGGTAPTSASRRSPCEPGRRSGRGAGRPPERRLADRRQPAARRARVLQAVAEHAEPPTGVVVIGDVRLDHRSREVHLRADEMRLSAAEFDVLAMLMDHAGRLVTTRRPRSDDLARRRTGAVTCSRCPHRGVAPQARPPGERAEPHQHDPGHRLPVRDRLSRRAVARTSRPSDEGIGVAPSAADLVPAVEPGVRLAWH